MTFYQVNEIINPLETDSIVELENAPRSEIKPYVINADHIAAFNLGLPTSNRCVLYLQGRENKLTIFDFHQTYDSFHKQLEKKRFVRVYFKRRIVLRGEDNKIQETIYRDWWRVDPRFIVAMTEERTEDGQPMTAILLSGIKEKLLSIDTMEQIKLRIDKMPDQLNFEYDEAEDLYLEDVRQYKAQLAFQS